jgi:phenylacetate-CoA ligase
MPFIRYEIGDLGIQQKIQCACNNPAPILTDLKGRIDSFIMRPDGRIVYDAILAYSLKKGVKAFQAIQNSPKDLTINLIPEGEFEKQKALKYEKKMRKFLGREIKIRFEEVSEIPKDKSGKLRYFISNIKNE